MPGLASLSKKPNRNHKQPREYYYQFTGSNQGNDEKQYKLRSKRIILQFGKIEEWSWNIEVEIYSSIHYTVILFITID